MTHIEISYNPDTKNLKIFYNGKLYGGMIGDIAERRYKVLKKEIERIDALKSVNNGHKVKKTKA